MVCVHTLELCLYKRFIIICCQQPKIHTRTTHTYTQIYTKHQMANRATAKFGLASTSVVKHKKIGRKGARDGDQDRGKGNG